MFVLIIYTLKPKILVFLREKKIRKTSFHYLLDVASIYQMGVTFY